MEPITIRQITLADSSYFNEGVDLLNRTQGQDLFPENYLNLRAGEASSYIVGAFDERKLLGIGIAQIIDTFDFYLPFDSEIKFKLNDKKVGSFSTLAVVEGCQGRGIGQKLSAERYKWLRSQGCSVILGVSWVSGLEHTSDRVFEKMGFKALKKVDHFFRQMSIENPFYCPGCRKSPCECAGILYQWNRD